MRPQPAASARKDTAPPGTVPGLQAAPPVADADGDAAVITRSLDDPEQFAVLFRRHAAVIHRYITRRIGLQPADDVVAETFLVAFRQRASYRPDGRNCLPWLYGIATNLVGRHRRSETAQFRLLARTGTDPVTEAFTDQVDSAVVAGSAKPRLAAALARLPAAQRDALLLLAWAGLSYEEVAAATGVPLGTVQSRISRARRRLREQLADLDQAGTTAEPASARPPSRPGPSAAGLPPAGLPPAGLPPAGLPPAGLPPAGLPSAGLPPASLH